jgi:hypothetical protein
MADLGDAQEEYPLWFQKEWKTADIEKKGEMTAEAPCQPSQTLYRTLSL